MPNSTTSTGSEILNLAAASRPPFCNVGGCFALLEFPWPLPLPIIIAPPQRRSLITTTVASLRLHPSLRHPRSPLTMKLNMSSIQEHFKSDKHGHSDDSEQQHRDSGYNPAYQNAPQKPLPGKDWPIPKFRIQVADLSSPGSIEFFANLHPTELLREAVMVVLTTLYTPENCPRQ